MQWVIVNYARTRDVFVDGRRSGQTNRLLIVGDGTHEFHLNVPVDYKPRKRIVTVTGTSAASPTEIEFRSET